MTASSIRFSSQGLRAHPPTIARLMTMALEHPKLLSLAAGFTDNASLPMAEVLLAAEELAKRSLDKEVLQYGMNQGRLGLRKLLAARFCELEQQGAGALDKLVSGGIITNGSQQALYLAMQVLCEAGDIVLVDRPSYFVFLEMLAGLGIRAISVPCLADGSLDAAGFDSLLARLTEQGEAERIKALYFVSYFSNPSSRSLGLEEKRNLARTLTKYSLRIPAIEDAAYRELYFEKEHPVPSIHSLEEWAEFPRFYLSTLTKSFATGLKIGYGFCSDEEWLARMLSTKGHQDFGSSNYSQAICEQVIASGAFDRQLEQIRKVYLAKMHALDNSLVEGGLQQSGWSWNMPEGGLYLWLEAPAGVATGLESELCRLCLEEGVIYVPGELCHGDRAPHNRLRLSYGVLGLEALAEAGRRFVRAVQRLGN